MPDHSERKSGDGSSIGHDFGDARIEEQVHMAKILADTIRLKILVILAGGDRNSGEIATRMALTQQAASHHLTMLRLSGLVETRRDGTRVIYSLDRAIVRRSYGLLEDLSRPPRRAAGSR